MRTQIAECLSAAGITKVVWIDDFFATPSRDESAETIYKCAAQLKAEGQLKIDFFTFGNVDLTQTKGEIEDAIDEIMEIMSEIDLAQTAQRLAGLCGVVNMEIPQPQDLSRDDFIALRDAFGAGLRTFSLGTWTSTGVQEFSSAADDTLFVIDKEFIREPGGIDGTKLLGKR